MKKFVKKILAVIQFPFILPDFFKFFWAQKNNRFRLSIFEILPFIFDKTFKTNFDRHYVYHTSWAARKLKEINPHKHIDISSSLYFAGIASVIVPIDFYDYRPAELELSDLRSKEADLMHLPFADDSIESISCMHTVEHIGLGRYGDPLDPDGDLKAINELSRVLATGGDLLFVVPVGRPKIMFNAHRIYSYEQIIEYFSKLKLKEFSLIPEKTGGIIINASPEQVAKEDYACGCFWFTK